MSTQKRIEWIDAIRALAIACVVMCHSVEGKLYPLNPEFMSTVSMPSKLFALTMYTMGRIGVPLFLLMTGYLLLDREYDKEKTIKFWKTKCLSLFLVTELWILIYNLGFYRYDGIQISAVSVMKEMLLLNGFSINHMWYMPVILGLYLALPIIANGLRSLDAKLILVPYVIVAVMFMGLPAMNMMFQTMGYYIGHTMLSSGFTGGVYGLYLIGGYLLKKGIFRQIKTAVLALIAGGSFVAAVILQVCLYEKGVNYPFFYENILLLIIGISIFELMSRVDKIPMKKLINALSYYSFAIYLIHNPIAITAKNIFSTTVEVRQIGVLMVWTITMISSLLIAFLINKIPKVGSKILYIK